MHDGTPKLLELLMSLPWRRGARGEYDTVGSVCIYVECGRALKKVWTSWSLLSVYNLKVDSMTESRDRLIRLGKGLDNTHIIDTSKGRLLNCLTNFNNLTAYSIV